MYRSHSGQQRIYNSFADRLESRERNGALVNVVDLYHSILSQTHRHGATASNSHLGDSKIRGVWRTKLIRCGHACFMGACARTPDSRMTSSGHVMSSVTSPFDSGWPRIQRYGLQLYALRSFAAIPDLRYGFLNSEACLI